MITFLAAIELMGRTVAVLIPFAVGWALGHWTTRASYRLGRKHEREMVTAFLKQGAEWPLRQVHRGPQASSGVAKELSPP